MKTFRPIHTPQTRPEVRSRLRFGADPSPQAGEGECRTPLRPVALVDVWPVLPDLLLDAGADPNHKITLDSPLIHIPVETCSVGAVRQLLAHGDDPDSRNIHGDTLLFRAAQAGKVDVVVVLLAAGADPNREDAAARSCG